MRPTAMALLLTFATSILVGCDSSPSTSQAPTPSELTPEKSVTKPGSGSRPSNKVDPRL